MIIDVPRFLMEERKYWNELESLLRRVEREPFAELSLEQIKRFHFLYQRACADLVKLQTSAHEPGVSRYLESLVGRGYGEVYHTARTNRPMRIVEWLTGTLPRTFRRQIASFLLAACLTAIGVGFGAGAMVIDPSSKAYLMPFSQLNIDPSERVRMEESGDKSALEPVKARFSAFLMTHNIRVAFFTLSLGATWGIGTAIVLLQNGTGLGAVAADYILAGHLLFLLGWLLPHGVVEIPAILVAAQAGFVLAGALIGRARSKPLVARLRDVSADLVTLIGGAALLLVWAGIVEGFFSQYHEPVLPYWVKIAFGVGELILLTWYLFFVGRGGVGATPRPDPVPQGTGTHAEGPHRNGLSHE